MIFRHKHTGDQISEYNFTIVYKDIPIEIFKILSYNRQFFIC
jgi:hypothetical protein